MKEKLIADLNYLEEMRDECISEEAIKMYQKKIDEIKLRIVSYEKM